MDQSRIIRINELSKKSRTEGLSIDEKVEQQALREEYIQAFRGNLKSTLDSIVIVDKKGNQRALKPKDID